LQKKNIDICKKTNIILDLQKQLNDHTSKIEELDLQVSEYSNEIVNAKEKCCELIKLIKKLNYQNKILNIELKFSNLQLNHSKRLSK
jgi:peptidoglycan hydrolase CwlO-like protein